MYRIIAFAGGNEYQAMTRDFRSALDMTKKSRTQANSIRVLNEKGQCVITYLKGLGLGLNAF